MKNLFWTWELCVLREDAIYLGQEHEQVMFHRKLHLNVFGWIIRNWKMQLYCNWLENASCQPKTEKIDFFGKTLSYFTLL